VPYHERWGIIPNEEGRVMAGERGSVVPLEYVVGWAKRGPSGLIGTNSPDSKATVEKMVEDVPGITSGEKEDVEKLLRGRGVRYVGYPDWARLDQMERERGEAEGRIRKKFTEIGEMLTALGEG
jgi:ferredoxin--NADP+ reductase